ncbi:peptidylprolyl isomerase/peptidyl-prolyl cis-trans isomerase D [Nonlabens sp. Hel1_33_55]|uniref:SurA N-terminal domain-containing protein n=1 Tax=Nonlabens sp. Hel1_33_55 TaxID=1336802 RepID=UPI000875D00D|nr:SurA N-terminal domain-containing protein [Nonlabens sp. Hel1_33_55]SCY44542.1 peptidylprolyl isomerase/peptidyl-prolyl cis-trans isomerase D [Nonlabens sp. Hel1_33_55]
MAILGKIRSQGVILIIIIALALFAFIIGDLIRQGSFTSEDQNVIGYVGDTELDRQQFTRQVEASMNQRAGMSTIQAVNGVWEQQVRDAVLKQQIDEAGIQVTDEEVSNYMKAAYARFPQFQDENGQFSDALFAQYVNQAATQNPQGWAQDLASAENQVRQQKLFTLLKSGVIGTRTDGEFAYRLENDKRDFQYVNIPYSSISDSAVEIIKSDIKDYIKKNEKQFQADAQRDIEYVLFEDKASTEDVTAINKELSSLIGSKANQYNEQTKKTESVAGLRDTQNTELFINANSDLPYSNRYTMVSSLTPSQRELTNLSVGEIYGPYNDGEFAKISKIEDKKTINDSVKNRHILVSFAGASRAGSDVTRDKAAAKKMADSILGTIGQSKDNYDEKYEYYQENEPQILAQDLGWVVYSGNAAQFAPGYTKFLYANNEGTVGVAESDFGYHVIRIDETAGAGEAIKLATVAKRVNASKSTSKSLYTKTQKFQQAAESGDFDELAKEYEVTATPVRNLKALDESLPALGRNRDIVKWSFNNDREVGDVERFETTQGYVVVKLSRVSEEGLMTVEEASPKVTPILRNKKKAEMIKAKINSTDLNTIATNQKQQVSTANAVNRMSPVLAGVGQEPKVVGTAFGLKEGQTSAPIAGDKGVFVIKLTGIDNAPDLDNYTNDSRTVAQRTANQSTSALVEALKKATKIEDKRSVFY